MRHLALVALMMASSAVSAATEPTPAKTTNPAAATTAADAPLVWPAPPLPPRIRHVATISKAADIGREKGFWRKVWEFIRGEDEFEQILRPMAVATDSQERLLVADTKLKRIHIFDRRKKEYTALTGSKTETFLLPIGLAVDGRDFIYVADGERKKIYIFRPDGEFDRVLMGMSGLGRPASLAIDRAHQRLYVVDPPLHNVKIVDLASGQATGVIGKRGEGPGEFNYPSHVAVDREGRLAVTDAMNKRIQLFDAEGKPVLTFGKHGDGSGDFTAPKGVALDGEGHLYIADAGFDNVQIFDRKGRLLLYWGNSGQKAGQFWMPAGIHIDENNRIYVADSHNSRVQIFEYLGASAERK